MEWLATELLEADKPRIFAVEVGKARLSLLNLEQQTNSSEQR